MTRIRNTGSTESTRSGVERRGIDRRTQDGNAPAGVERRNAERRGPDSADGFEASKAAPLALHMAAPSGAEAAAPPPPVEPAAVVHASLISSAYRECLRREPFGTAARYWDSQLVALAAEGNGPEKLAAWLRGKLYEADEGKALKLADEVIAEAKGVDVGDRRTGIHELAVRRLRDEKRPAESVRTELKARLAAAASSVLLPAAGEEARNGIIEAAYRDCLRRAPFGTAASYWSGQLVDLQAQGQSTAEITTWLREKLSSVEEGRALKLADEAFAQVAGADVSDRRTGLHELAVRMLRDQKRSPDEVREHLRARLANADEVSTAEAPGEHARSQLILDAYRACLRREPTDDASSYWDGHLIDLEIAGADLAALRTWMHDKLSSVEEGRALQLVDEVYRQVKGEDVTGKRTDLHERAVVMLRDEKKTPDEVRDWVRLQLTEIPKTGNAFLDRHAAQAIAAMRATGVPASLTLAQAMLESDSGRSGLTRRYNNFFGIKGSGSGGSVSLLTTEYRNGKAYKVHQNFAVYRTVEDSFVAHGHLIAGTGKWKPHYARPWGEYQRHGDAVELARGIAGIYATDPRYAQKIVDIMRDYDLMRFDQYA